MTGGVRRDKEQGGHGRDRDHGRGDIAWPGMDGLVEISAYTRPLDPNLQYSTTTT